MPLFLALLLSWSSPIHAKNLSCRGFFEIVRLEEKASHVFSSQTSVGKAYAEVKLLRKAGLAQHRSLDELTIEQRQQATAYIGDRMTQEVPAVISPSGKIFIIDANHDIFGAALLGFALKSLSLQLVIQKDYQKTDFTEDAFIADMVAKGWGERAALENPRTVDKLDDNPQRSLMGLVFSYIEESQGTFVNYKGNTKSNVSFQGKYFSPRIQFRLIDLLVEQRLLSESPSLTPEFIKHIANVILSNPATLGLLRDALQPTAPVELVLFLQLRTP